MFRYLTKERTLGLLLVIITLALYFKVVTFGFVNWDDNPYIVQNDYVQAGLTWDSIKWAFTTFYSANWHPLTWLSHMLDFEIYGLHPAGHHLVNVFLHLTNSLLLFYFFKTATGAVWRSFLVALIFAIHPLHVESVAWVSERKDVLCSFFWLLTMVFYLRFVKQRSIKNYSLVLGSFILGLLSKPMIVTLPFALLLLDFWPLNRINISGPNFLRRLKPLLIEKMPLFFLSAVSSIITFIAQKEGGAVASTESLQFQYRLINSLLSYLKYMIKFFYPVDLHFLYIHTGANYSAFMLILSASILILVSVFIILNRNKRPYLIFGWLWFLGTLVPVIGLVQVGMQAMADRYTYIPLVGLILMIAWSLPALQSKVYDKLLIAFSFSCILALSVSAWAQIDVWKDSKALLLKALKADPKNYVALAFLGQEVAKEGKFEEALSLCTRALSINPKYGEGHLIISNLYMVQNMNGKAIETLERILRVKPALNRARISLSDAYLRNNNFEKALVNVEIAEKSLERNSWNLNMVGIIWSGLGKSDTALERFNEALALRPSAPETLNNIAALHINKKEARLAIPYLEKAVKLSPLSPEILNNYGRALTAEEKYEDAIYNFLLALRTSPDYGKARKNLNETILKMSDKIKNSRRIVDQ